MLEKTRGIVLHTIAYSDKMFRAGGLFVAAVAGKTFPYVAPAFFSVRFSRNRFGNAGGAGYFPHTRCASGRGVESYLWRSGENIGRIVSL